MLCTFMSRQHPVPGESTPDPIRSRRSGWLEVGTRAAGFLFVAFLLFPSGISGQRIGVRNYSQVDGLPQIQIYAIHQDARGFIWVGSNAGLARYDGRRFHSLTSAQGLVSNTVVQIDETPSGTIVAATSAGVCFLDGGRFSCLGPESGLVREQVRDLHVDATGDVWVAADDGISLIRWGDRQVRTFGLEDGLPSLRTGAILRDRAGTLWAGTDGGLVRFNGIVWEDAPPSGLHGVRVASLSQDGEALLIGTERGIFALRDTELLTIPLGPDPGLIRLLARGKDGAIWAVSDRGVYRHERGASVLLTPEHGIPAQDLWSILVDREGNIWMGSDDGLAKLVPGPFALYTQAQGLPHPFVRAITQTPDGRIWFGTRDGLAVLQGDGMVEVPFRTLVPDTRIFSLAPDPSGGLLVGTANGLVHRSSSGSLRSFGIADGLPHGFVYSIVDDGEGGAWIGTARGIARWSEGRIRPPDHPLLKDAVALSLVRGDDGRLWAGLVAGGVLIVDGDSVQKMGEEEGLSDQTIWSLAPDGTGGMWVGTNGDGGFHVSPGGIRRLSAEDGLGDDFIWQVGVDSRSDVWFYSGHGINRLSGTQLAHFGSGEGLLDPEGSASAFLEDSGGSLWFGCGSGVYRYEPDLDREVPPPTRAFLESVTVGGRAQSTDSMAFPSRPGTIVFRFSAPSYQNEDQIRFRYRLAGGDEEWSEPSPEPSVAFARLGAGEYELQVVAVSEWGRRSQDILTIPFAVKPAFWETWWFRVGSGLALLTALLQIPGLRARHLEAERKRLETLVRERTAEIQENAIRLEREIQERKESERAREVLESQLRQAQKMEAVGRLAGGIAHDFNNLLTSVLGHAELLAANASPGSELGQDLDEIKRSAQKGAALVSQLLAFSRQQIVQWQPVDVCATIRETTGMVGRVIGAQVHLEVDLPATPLWVRGDPNQLGQVLLNLAVNARDAMPRGGELLIAASQRSVEEIRSAPFSDAVPPGEYVCMLVSDAGEGMDGETLRRAFEPFFTTKEVGKGTGLGLASVYGIVHQHQGFIQVSAAPGEGAQFEIYLPEVLPGPASD